MKKYLLFISKFSIYGILSTACIQKNADFGVKKHIQQANSLEYTLMQGCQKINFCEKSLSIEVELKDQGNYLVLDDFMDRLDVRTNNGPAGSVFIFSEKEICLDRSPINIYNNNAYCQVRIDDAYLPKLGEKTIFYIGCNGTSLPIFVKRHQFEFRFLEDLEFLKNNVTGSTLEVNILEEDSNCRNYIPIEILEHLSFENGCDKYLARYVTSDDFFTILVDEKIDYKNTSIKQRIFSCLLLEYNLEQFIDGKKVILEPLYLSFDKDLNSDLNNIEVLKQDTENRLEFLLDYNEEPLEEVALFIPYIDNTYLYSFITKKLLSYSEEIISKCRIDEIKKHNRLLKEKNRKNDKIIFEIPYYYEFLEAKESLLVYFIQKKDNIWYPVKPYFLERDEQKSFMDIYNFGLYYKHDPEQYKSLNLSVSSFVVDRCNDNRTFTIKQFLGSGYGGTVYKIEDNNTKIAYAMKVTKSNRVFEEVTYNNVSSI